MAVLKLLASSWWEQKLEFQAGGSEVFVEVCVVQVVFVEVCVVEVVCIDAVEVVFVDNEEQVCVDGEGEEVCIVAVEMMLQAFVEVAYRRRS